MIVNIPDSLIPYNEEDYLEDEESSDEESSDEEILEKNSEILENGKKKGVENLNLKMNLNLKKKETEMKVKEALNFARMVSRD
jgi:hypothetical protein